MAGVPPSPDSLQLRGSPLASARLSKKAALFAVGALAIILGVIIVNVSKERPVTKREEDASQKVLQPALNAAKTLTRDVPEIDEPIEEPPPVSRPSRAPAVAQAVPRTSEDEARMADTVVGAFSDAAGEAGAPEQNAGRFQPASLTRPASAQGRQ